MSTNFSKEFKLYEGLFSERASKTTTKKTLTEARGAEEIQAEIDRLQQELNQVKATEKRAAYNGKFPKVLYAWDIYADEDEKGTWCSAEKSGIDWDGYVYETKDAAIQGGWDHLNELANEGELEYDPDEYTVDAFEIPFKELTAETLEYSDLEHLIPPIV